MVTTFFGETSFGGDAVFVERLATALLARGHEVEVVHLPDAYELVKRGAKPRPYRPPPGLVCHPLRSRLGPLGVLWIHQTGGLGPLRRSLADRIVGSGFDVLHFHNISLIGGPAALETPAGAPPPVRLMTASEHWLVCPLSLLWRMDREPCERPTCTRCTLAAGRPPQWWRAGGSILRAVSRLDALIFPSRHTLESHHRRGIRHRRAATLPYLLPDRWFELGGSGPPDHPPYLVAAGRFVREKGFEQLIAWMDRLPGIELRVVGSGPLEPELRRLASARTNVLVLEWLDQPELAQLIRGAVAVAVPSRFPETFGYAAAEAIALGTPALVSDQGSLPELIEATGGGLVCRTEEDWLDGIRRVAGDPALRERLGEEGRRRAMSAWSERSHVDRYLELVEACRAGRA